MEKKFMNKMDDMELDMVVGGARVYLVTKIRNHLGIVDYHVAQGNYDGDMKDLDKLAEVGKIDELRKKAKMRDNGMLRPGVGLEFNKNMREEGKHVIIIEGRYD